TSLRRMLSGSAVRMNARTSSRNAISSGVKRRSMVASLQLDPKDSLPRMSSPAKAGDPVSTTCRLGHVSALMKCAVDTGCPPSRIGAKIPFSDIPVVWVAHEDVVEAPLWIGGGKRGLAAGRWLEARRRRVAATDAKRRVASSGLRQAGRGLELVDERFEQKDEQKMGQHVRSGGAFGDARWSFQTNHAFQPLEAEFNAPSQAIESEDIGGGEFVAVQRGHDDHPIRGDERFPGELPAFSLGFSAG